MEHSEGRSFVPRIAAVCAAGVAAAVVLFALTSWYPNRAYLGPLCRSNTFEAGFDPWTGLPHGSSYVCEPTFAGDPPAHLVADPIPPDLVGRRAIPIPVGFAIGMLMADLFAGLRHGQRRRHPASSAS